MVYTSFTEGKPDIVDTGGDVIDTTRENLMALRDAIVMGMLVSWDLSASGGTAKEPTTLLYSKGTERIRATVTWGTSGGSDGGPTSILWEYSADSGSTYDVIGTLSATFDVDGNVTASSWS